MFNMKKSITDIFQERLDWCVKTERYEMAAAYRDLIIDKTTDDKIWKQEYYYKLLEKYAPEFLEVLISRKPNS